MSQWIPRPRLPMIFLYWESLCNSWFKTQTKSRVKTQDSPQSLYRSAFTFLIWELFNQNRAKYFVGRKTRVKVLVQTVETIAHQVMRESLRIVLLLFTQNRMIGYSVKKIISLYKKTESFITVKHSELRSCLIIDCTHVVYRRLHENERTINGFFVLWIFCLLFSRDN